MTILIISFLLLLSIYLILAQISQEINLCTFIEVHLSAMNCTGRVDVYTPCDHHCNQDSVYFHHSGKLLLPLSGKSHFSWVVTADIPVDQPRLLINGITLSCLAFVSLGFTPVCSSFPLPFYDRVGFHCWPPLETMIDPHESPWPGRQPLGQKNCELTSLWVRAPTLAPSHHVNKGEGARKPHLCPS